MKIIDEYGLEGGACIGGASHQRCHKKLGLGLYSISDGVGQDQLIEALVEKIQEPVIEIA